MNYVEHIGLGGGALLNRLGRYLDLADEERGAIETMQASSRRLAPGETLMQEGGSNDAMYVVEQGWLHSSVRLAVGGRQIVRFHYAGDLVGTSSIAWSQAATTLTAIVDCTVAEVPKAALGHLFATERRLGGLLYAIAAAESVAMADRLISVGRMNAIDRVTTLLLDMVARLRVTAGGIVDSFEMPLTQEDIGDATGLTKVHVNRTLREMERRGMIARTGKRVRMLDESAMLMRTGFVDRYTVVATDWLPRDVKDRA